MNKDTLLAHVGRDPLQQQGMVNTPVYRTSTVINPNVESYEAPRDPDYQRISYGRHGTPTTRALEEAVARLEGGYHAVALPSGLAAIAAAISAFAKSGAHILVADTVYAPTRMFCDQQLKANGVEVEYYDPVIGEGIAALIRDNTKAVFCESPGSLTFEIQDIPAIAEAAHARGVPVLADNTWGTPYFFRSFDRGVDVSIHSATKYISGHSDVMLGLIVTTEQHWRTVRRTVAEYGYGVSPDDCYLALRGFRTLGVRLKQHMGNALGVARWLRSRPEVRNVLFPALSSHPGNAIWRRDFTGATGLFSFVLRRASERQAAAFVNSLTLFGIGSSWGGYESLATVAHPERARTATKWSAGGPTIRLHIGLEDSADLMADLEQAFRKLGVA
ncbi:MAG TPA: cystathionine beta-lyase [Burkholderiales bacterium]|nr:cystathionine beta-lyase [Burkholderiales bacterium]